MAETWRLFVALELPGEVREGLARVQDELKRAAPRQSWTRAEGVHCTLKFLGDTPPSLIPSVGDALGSAAAVSPPFPIRVGGLGVFPNTREPRVLWVGVSTVRPHLEQLAQRVDERLAAAGFARETRRFHPHLTLGRVRDLDEWPALHARILDLPGSADLGGFRADSFALFRSELGPGGAVYTALRHFSLGG